MVAWPDAFPKPEVGFSASFGSTVDGVRMDSGETRQRHVRRGVRRLLSASFVLKGPRLAMFNAWFKHKLQDGVLSVTLTLPMGGAETSVEAFFIESGYKVTLKEAPFTWLVQTQLEIYT